MRYNSGIINKIDRENCWLFFILVTFFFFRLPNLIVVHDLFQHHARHKKIIIMQDYNTIRKTFTKSEGRVRSKDHFFSVDVTYNDTTHLFFVSPFFCLFLSLSGEPFYIIKQKNPTLSNRSFESFRSLATLLNGWSQVRF